MAQRPPTPRQDLPLRPLRRAALHDQRSTTAVLGGGGRNKPPRDGNWGGRGGETPPAPPRQAVARATSCRVTLLLQVKTGAAARPRPGSPALSLNGPLSDS